MLKVFLGDSFDTHQALGAFLATHPEPPEKVSGETLAPSDLPSIFQGVTLFHDQRLILIRDLSENKPVFLELEKYLDLPSDNTIILVEKKLDKRTTTFKKLKQHAEIFESSDFTKSPPAQQLSWVIDTASKSGLTLTRSVADFLLSHVGPDQWALASAVDKLSLLGREVDKTLVTDIIEPSHEQNIFTILEKALSGDKSTALSAVTQIELTSDPHQFFGLISHQIFMIAALKFSNGRSTQEVASDFKTHSFAMSKNQSLASRISPSHTITLLKRFLQADRDLKSSSLSPWLIIKSLLSGL